MEVKLLHFALVVLVAVISDFVLSYMDHKVEDVVSNASDTAFMTDHQERQL